jgi:hypothetical protein
LEVTKLFGGFAGTVLELLDVHHHGEEEYWFPLISKKTGIDCQPFFAEHGTMMEILTKLRKDAVELRDAPVVPTPERWSQFALDFGTLHDIVVPHLDHEEKTFTTEVLDKHFTRTEQTQSGRILKDMAMKESSDGALTFALFYFTMSDPERAELNKHLPCILKSFLIPRVWRRRYAPFTQFYYNPIPGLV